VGARSDCGRDRDDHVIGHTLGRQRPRLRSDNGPSHIAGELAQWLTENVMGHVRGAPCHPQTQGKIERQHQTLKNRILLENYYLLGDLETKTRQRWVRPRGEARGALQAASALDQQQRAAVQGGLGHVDLCRPEGVQPEQLQGRSEMSGLARQPALPVQPLGQAHGRLLKEPPNQTDTEVRVRGRVAHGAAAGQVGGLVRAPEARGRTW